jgi:hypothetical protein
MDGLTDGMFSYSLLLLTVRHVLIRDIHSFPRVIKQTIEFITQYDNPSPPDLKDKREVFVGGGSLGGWTSLEYGLNPTENTAGIISWVYISPLHLILRF